MSKINKKTIKKLAEMCLNPCEIASILGVSEKDLEKFKELIEKSWPDDATFIKKRISRNAPFLKKGRANLLPKFYSSIRMHIADMIAREMGGTSEIIGYDPILIIGEMEKKFKPGMSWANWGEWQIDHIRPRSSFKMSEIKECFSLSNLQPLWKRENARKGKKWVKEGQN